MELLWLLLCLLATLLYGTASVAWDSPVPAGHLLQFQAVPLLACAVWYWSRPLYFRCCARRRRGGRLWAEGCRHGQGAPSPRGRAPCN